MSELIAAFDVLCLVINILALYLTCYAGWNGSYFKTGNIEIELYGIKRFFKKENTK